MIILQYSLDTEVPKEQKKERYAVDCQAQAGALLGNSLLDTHVHAVVTRAVDGVAKATALKEQDPRKYEEIVGGIGKAVAQGTEGHAKFMELIKQLGIVDAQKLWERLLKDRQTRDTVKKVFAETYDIDAVQAAAKKGGWIIDPAAVGKDSEEAEADLAIF